MIIGDYPCCEAPLWINMADETPMFEKEICPNCGEVVWHYHSRLNPVSYTDKGFHEEYEVNEDTKEITKKDKDDD